MEMSMALPDQVPVHSGFGAKSTGSEVIADCELAGKVAIVTGGYSGIGLETVRALASKGVRVIVPVRDRAKAGAAFANIAGAIEMADMDLGNIATVRHFAQSMVSSLPKLDFLINNAGIMACPETRVGPGWEAQFGTNHLGHMALSLGLMHVLWRYRRPVTRSVAFAGTTSISRPLRMKSGRPMANPRRPMHFSPTRSAAA
jgi:NAD(P)-dependent dehydrogenase (short-subunit alcohol dehydrogenase family)